MPDIPRWLEELRGQQAAAPTGTIAVLREIVRTGKARRIEGVKTPPQAAELMLGVYDGLPPREQEVFAAECNTDFRGCARRCLAAEALGPLADLFTALLGAGGCASVAAFVTKLGKAVREGLREPSDRDEKAG